VVQDASRQTTVLRVKGQAVDDHREVVVKIVDRGVRDAHLRPPCVEFFGENRGKRARHALTHLGAGDHHGDEIVGADADPAIQGMLAGFGGQWLPTGQALPWRGHAPAKHQGASGACAGKNQTAAAQHRDRVLRPWTGNSPMPRPLETSDRIDPPPRDTAPALCLFDSPLGNCGIAWSGAGVLAVQLPAVDDAATLARLAHAARGRDAASPSLPVVSADEAPPVMAAAIAGVVALFSGQARDLREVPLDQTGIPDFARRVYALAREIAPGATLSYGELARRLGEPGAARAVGRALGDNPFVIVVPCHRVLAAGGRPGGFSAPGGLATKRRLLEIEAACRPPLSPGQSGRLF